MTILDIILIGFALSLDAFAVTLSNCFNNKNLTLLNKISMPICFSIFQFVMPILGFYFGFLISDLIISFSKYLTFIIFSLLAIKIIIDKLKDLKKDKKEINEKKFSYLTLILQGFLTSIDAFVIGISFAVSLNLNIFLSSLIIGIVTFLIVCCALIFNKFLSKYISKYAEYIAALILIFIAIKSLI